MKISEFNQFQEFTQQYGVIFYYSGAFTQNVIAAMGDALKTKLECQNQKGSTLRKIFSVFIEMAQNIMHYSETIHDEGGNQYRFGAIAIGRKDEKYFVLCGNLVNKAAAEELNDKLGVILAMSKEEIKQAYKTQLQSDFNPDNQGAGLGLLTVAKDSIEPIEYKFIEAPFDGDGHTFFYIKATIN